MKSTRLLFIFLCMLVLNTTYADIIPENSHYVNKCVKITNLDDYPQIALIGFGNCWGSNENFYSYVISDSECLSLNYKHDAFSLFAVSKIYLAGKDSEKPNLPGNKNALISNISIYPLGSYVNDTISISSQDQFYKIMGFTDSTVVLFKWKEITKYNDGTPEKTEFFDYTGNISSLTQEFPITQIYEEPSDIDYPKVLKIELFPNPTKDNLIVFTNETYQGNLKIKIYSLNGVLFKSYLFSKTSPFATFTIPINDFPRGNYIVKIEYGQVVESEKLVIN